MFSNLAWSEMLLIACVAIIVVGPKDLPAMLRQFGNAIGNVKRLAGDFQRQLNDAVKEAELDELKDMTSTKGFAPLEDAKKSMEEFANTMNDPVEAATKPEPQPQPETKPAAKSARKPAARKPAAKKPATATKSAAARTSKPATKRAAPKKPAATKRKAAATTKSTT